MKDFPTGKASSAGSGAGDLQELGECILPRSLERQETMCSTQSRPQRTQRFSAPWH